MALDGTGRAATVVISPGGAGTFVVRALDFENVAAIDLTVDYDPATLANIQVIRGTFLDGALVAANPNLLGRVRLAAIRSQSLNGSGAIATLSGFPQSGSLGKVLSLSAKLTDPRGNPLPVQIEVDNPAEPDIQSNETKTEGEAVGGTGGETEDASGTTGPRVADADTEPDFIENPLEMGEIDSSETPSDSGTAEKTSSTISTISVRSGTAGSGSITFPSSVEAVPEKEEERGAEEVYPPTGLEGHVAPGRTDSNNGLMIGKNPFWESDGPSIRRFVAVESALERFRKYEGERNFREMTDLFKASLVGGLRQTPEIAISDGSSPVRLAIADGNGDRQPSFAISNARLLWSGPGEGGGWLVDILPKRGSWEVRLLALFGDTVVEIPLTVVPPIPLNLGGSEDDSEGENSPLFDLNGDGIRDYIDDYIFTASFIASPNSSEAIPQNSR